MSGTRSQLVGILKLKLLALVPTHGIQRYEAGYMRYTALDERASALVAGHVLYFSSLRFNTSATILDSWRSFYPAAARE